jgi:four helix bundle protein
MSRDYHKLKVFDMSHILTIKIYDITKRFPRDELFGLTSQMRRASVSIPANIAEGSARRSKKEYVQFLSNALGSASELEYYIFLSKDLHYISNNEYEDLRNLENQVARMLQGLIKAIESKP